MIITGVSVVLNVIPPRSYLIKTPGGLVRQNRTDLRPAEAVLSCNRQPLTQQAVPPVVQQDVATSYSSVVFLTTPAGTTPSPVESPKQKSSYSRPIRPQQRLAF